MTHPPRLARRVLRFFVPADARDAVDGDLAELHAAHVATRGRVYAAAWYWKEAVSFATRFNVDRVRRGANLLASTRDVASSLDVRLSARLLIKHPGLTLIAGFGIAAAIGISGGFFAFLRSQLNPTIPLEAGDRIVALENWNIAIDNEARQSAGDFSTWRDEMKTVVEVSAFRNIRGSLETGPASAEDITVAGMTASGFHLARVPALLGRYLVPDDERPGAPPVLVIGHDIWRARFNGDSSVLGRQLRINETLFSIVGVMPAGFGFPVNHQYWTTLRFDPAKVERGQGPELYVFGRLAAGATMESARAELAAIGQRTAAAFPKTNAQLRPRVWPYTAPILDIQGMGWHTMWLFQLTISLIVVVVALNVAILVYARTAVRRSEIAVRTALGASRRRIVGQLFVEAIALSLPPAVVGLALAQYGLKLGWRQINQGIDALGGRSPFWADAGVQPETAAFALGLAVVTATIVGVLPALQATGRRIESDLRQLGGATGMQLGRMWTVLVVAQVAFAVAVLPPALKLGFQQGKDSFTRTTYPATQFTSGMLSVKRTRIPAGERTPPFGAKLGDVVRAMRSNPAVVGVSFLSYAPTGPTWSGRIEIEGMKLPADMEWRSRPQGVDTTYLDLYGVRLLIGRQFASSDLGDSARVVIVNRSFVRRMLGDRAALGRRFRYVSQARSDTAAPPRWFEIVGVVDDLQRNPFDANVIVPRVYHPVAPERLSGVTMIIRTKGMVPPTFGTTMHETIAATDPDLRLGTLHSGESANAESKGALQIIGTMMLLVLGTVLLLSAAGVSALMSFTVTQRRREIGIRAALGASQSQVLIKVFSRATWQVGAGVALGVVAAAVINSLTGSDANVPSIILVPIVAIIMIAVGLGAAYLPTRRGMSIQPVEALRNE